jgi:hypothetical protein
MTTMNMEQLVEWQLEGKAEVLGENLSQCRYVHYKSHMIWPGLEPGPPRWEASDFSWHFVQIFGKMNVQSV